MNIENVYGTDIIYEKIYDEDGNCYGKELVSGEIFPINLKYSDYDISYEYSSTTIFLDCQTGMSYELDDKLFNLAVFRLTDACGEKHNITDKEHYLLSIAFQNNDEHKIRINDQYVILTPAYPKCFLIKMKPKMIFSPNLRVEYMITEEKIANELEVNNYLRKFEMGFGRKKRRREYVKKIKEMCLSNYLGDNINFCKNDIVKDRIKEEVITKEMEELEYILSRLKSVSVSEYNKINGEYNEVLKNDDINALYINPLAISTIISLQNKANLAYICHGGDSVKIMEFLNNQAYIYLYNFINNVKIETELTIMELDEITERFLSIKNSYSYNEQNNILRNLALLYFFELYENIDVLTADDLINSYVLDIIKRIITVISILQDENIIKSISFAMYDIKNIDELLNLIKKIEFNRDFEIEDKTKSLIKKLQR